MLKVRKHIFIVFLLVVLSCEKDDICPADTPTTPLLILTFADINDPDSPKAVDNFIAYGLDDTNTVVFFNSSIAASTDSIAVPLRDDSDLTRIVLQRDVLDGDLNTGNPDIISSNYERQSVFVSRACGFKNTYLNLNTTLENDADLWIQQLQILNSNVEDQISAHVKILH